MIKVGDVLRIIWRDDERLENRVMYYTVHEVYPDFVYAKSHLGGYMTCINNWDLYKSGYLKNYGAAKRQYRRRGREAVACG